MLNIYSYPWYIYLCIKPQNDILIVSKYFPGFQIGVKNFSESNSLEVIGILRFFRVWTVDICFSGAQRMNARHGNSLFFSMVFPQWHAPGIFSSKGPLSMILPQWHIPRTVQLKGATQHDIPSMTCPSHSAWHSLNDKPWARPTQRDHWACHFLNDTPRDRPAQPGHSAW